MFKPNIPRIRGILNLQRREDEKLRIMWKDLELYRTRLSILSVRQ